MAFRFRLHTNSGAGDYKGMRKYVANCAWLGIAFSVVLTLVTVVLCRQILELMRTPDDIIDFSYQYIVIIFAAIPFTFLYNIVSGVIRALGDSRTPVIFLVISSIVNIGFDLFFIIVLKLGVAGAAWATAIAQVVAGVGCLSYMIKKFDILHIRKDEWAVNAHMMGSLCAMGVPMGLQYSITAIGSVILQTATNTLVFISGCGGYGSRKGMRFPCTALTMRWGQRWQPTEDRMSVQESLTALIMDLLHACC